MCVRVYVCVSVCVCEYSHAEGACSARDASPPRGSSSSRTTPPPPPRLHPPPPGTCREVPCQISPFRLRRKWLEPGMVETFKFTLKSVPHNVFCTQGFCLIRDLPWDIFSFQQTQGVTCLLDQACSFLSLFRPPSQILLQHEMAMAMRP